jgi:hypothetical protein
LFLLPGSQNPYLEILLVPIAVFEAWISSGKGSAPLVWS